MAHQMPAASAVPAAGVPVKPTATASDVVVSFAAAPELERAPTASAPKAAAAAGHAKASNGSKWAIPFILAAAASIIAIAIGISIW